MDVSKDTRKMERKEEESVSVLGTGGMGRAVTKMLLLTGRDVIVGSRSPKERNLEEWDSSLEQAELTSIIDAIQRSNIIFLCLHFDHIEILKEYEASMQGKILVDVSNPLSKPDAKGLSNAEQIQALFPSCTVVKAFNTWSSYALDNLRTTPRRTVSFASDDRDASEIVSQLVRTAGLQPVQHHGLDKARMLERSTKGYLQQWKAPVLMVLVVFLAWFTYATFRFHYIKGRSFDRFLLNTLNKILGATGLTSLALVYLPGSLAAFTQLQHGTNTKPFPKYLACWLKCRRELGLLAFWFSGLHGLTSLALSAGYLSSMYPKPIQIAANFSLSQPLVLEPPTMVWRGEGTFFFGCLAIGFFVVPALTAVPSVGVALNQDQWWLCQSFLGHITLFTATIHVILKSCYSWGSKPFVDTLQKVSFLSLILPTATLILRLIVLMPCVWNKVKLIRRGGVLRKIEGSQEV